MTDQEHLEQDQMLACKDGEVLPQFDWIALAKEIDPEFTYLTKE